MQRYNPSAIEPKWQSIWRDDSRYTVTETEKPKLYVSGMFPYPSGSGLHSGHAFSYTIVDAIARFYRAHGHDVLNPMGWDTFGLPAENYAIKTGTAPAVVTKQNIANFKTQFKRLGISIDWTRELNTSDPEYYKWTQWIFTKFFERGLAYQKNASQWWCPVDKTVLANEQVEAGKCWRCGSEVEKKQMNQWFFKITDYADALLEEIPNLDWPEKIKTAQTNWIGRSQGAEIEFAVDGSDDSLKVFTTRPDTIFGATFMVIAPEHNLISSLVTEDTKDAVNDYVAAAVKKSEIDRMSESKNKTGMFTGSYAINPANGERIPIWVADYVLGGYGTGAVMAVPAHDERDYEFATKFNLPIVQVIAEHYVNRGIFEPRSNKETKTKMCVDAIITDGNGNYLIQKEDDNNLHFVGGGVDPEDDNLEEAILREVREESGYTAVKSVKHAAPIRSFHAYRDTKDINIIGHTYYFEITVDRESKLEESEIDKGLHTQKWVQRNNVAEMLSWVSHKVTWEYYLNEQIIDNNVREGVLVNSGHFDGLTTSEARETVVAWLEKQGIGAAKTTYKMRDWLISRQRYWGAPIPIIHCPEHGAVAVPEDQLPVRLPEVENYAPTGEGSVLATVDSWVNTECPTCGGPAKRETDTMDGYACSSWYLLRYTDPKNDMKPWDVDKANHWSPLNFYVGGDHAVAHLLYVRFWAHVFNDMGLLNHKEPVKKLVYHGYVNAEDGRKMSKSLGNVIDPMDIVDQGYGADCLRTYVLFMGPIELDSAWSSQGVGGVHRFLNRVWVLAQEYLGSEKRNDTVNTSLETLRHKTIKKVTSDFHELSFNTAIAALMEYVNELYKAKTNGFNGNWNEHIETLVQLLSPFAPHMTAELWELLGRDNLDTSTWPTWDSNKIIEESMTIVAQVNGKMRATLQLPLDTSEDEVKKAVLQNEQVQSHMNGNEPKRVIYVKGRLVNVVV